jgi:hypothetical protein
MKISRLTHIWMIAVLGASLSLAGSAQRAADPEVMLRAAIEKEEVDANLKAAIAMYRQIIARYAGNHAIAAKALVRLGGCYEYVGQADARQSYEQGGCSGRRTERRSCSAPVASRTIPLGGSPLMRTPVPCPRCCDAKRKSGTPLRGFSPTGYPR